MAERSTWPEQHLNAVNKLLCWDWCFLGKAIHERRAPATSHLPCTPSSCPPGMTSGGKSSSFGYCGRKKSCLSNRSPYHFSCEPFSNPTTKYFKTLIHPFSLIKKRSELQCVTRMQMCRSKGWVEERISLQRVYKDKEISDKAEKCTHIDCCHLGAC